MKEAKYHDRLYIAMHPVRKEILASLAKSAGYANKLASDMGLSSKGIQFHLSILQRHDLVDGKYCLTQLSPSRRPVAVKLFTLTGPGLKVLDALSKLRDNFSRKID